MLDADGQPRKDLFVADMLHMNAQGYAIWKEKIEKHFRAQISNSFSPKPAQCPVHLAGFFISAPGHHSPQYSRCAYDSSMAAWSDSTVCPATCV